MAGIGIPRHRSRRHAARVLAGRWQQRLKGQARSMRRGTAIAGAVCAAAIVRGAVLAVAGTTGTVTGTVRVGGPPPTRPALPVFKNREVCGDSVPDDRLVVGAGEIGRASCRERGEV